jgi:hypothetical protein
MACNVAGAAQLMEMLARQKQSRAVVYAYWPLMSEIARCFCCIPPFQFYALGNGIKKTLSRCNPSAPAEQPPNRLREFRLGSEA